MARRFVKLFDLEILHDYYVSGKSGDFYIQPTADTLKLIKGYRSIFKTRSLEVGARSTSGLSVVYEATDLIDTPLIPITTEVRFRFFMKLVNPVFLNFTELPAKNNASEIFYYDNTGGTPLAQTKLELQSKIFNYKFTSPNSPDELRIFGIDGNLITALTESLGAGPDFEVQLDLTNYPDGKYELKLFNSGSPTADIPKEIYFDNNLKGEGIFGIIEIFKDDNEYGDLKIEFEKADNFWKYFVVFKTGLGGNTYAVQDDESGGPFITFSIVAQVVDEINFTSQDQATVDALLNGLPSGAVVLFKSTAEVDYSETKKKEIQLVRTLPTSALLISNLPNPEIANPKSEAFVFV